MSKMQRDISGMKLANYLNSLITKPQDKREVILYDRAVGTKILKFEIKGKLLYIPVKKDLPHRVSIFKNSKFKIFFI